MWGRVLLMTANFLEALRLQCYISPHPFGPSPVCVRHRCLHASRQLTQQYSNLIITFQFLFNYASETNSSVADRYTNLMAAIVDNCQNKIKSRISKVLRRVRELSTDRGIHSEDRLPSELVKKLKAKLEIGPEQSLRNSLISWLDYLSPAERLWTGNSCGMQ
jgi:hypothetical protein